MKQNVCTVGIDLAKKSRSMNSSVSKVEDGGHGREKASKSFASLQAIGADMERRW
jgi:hypothetical protein